MEKIGHSCRYCEISLEWEGYDFRRGHIWQCDTCGEFFCSKCADELGGQYRLYDGPEVLCPDCLKITHEKGRA